jgi:hypothetical protein
MNKRKLKDTLIAAAWEENEGAYHVRLEDVFEIIDQLDEPEKVVVPEFVGEFIKKSKNDGYTLQQTFYIVHSNYKHGNFDEVVEWVSGHEKTFARAWLDGYEVEEKKYRVLDKEGCVLIRRYGETVRRVTSKVEPNQYPESERGVLALTEQEIKDYDPRFMAFAEPVEELEE